MFGFGSSNKVSTDPELVRALLTRGVEAVYPSREALETKLSSGQKLRVYYGIDPTGPSIHLGHAATILKLRDFQNLGHEVIVLVGDFTATIGDPDKKSVRVPLTGEQVRSNMKSYTKQLARLLDINKTKIVYNSEWLKKLNFEEVLKLASEVTVSQMLERDMFQERIKDGRPIYLHEFLYPLMQGYDSVVLGVDVEIGGNDQVFNMLTGRQLLKNRGKEKFVVANKLLVDSAGKKMGKTEGNMARLDDSPENVYGQVMSWPDDLVLLGAEICTRMNLDDTRNLFDKNPRDAKMLLAKEIVKMIYNDLAADKAERDFVSTFQKGELVPEKEVEIEGLIKATDLVKRVQEVSGSQAWRLVESGALEISGEVIKEPNKELDLSTGAVVRVGKKTVVEIKRK